MDSYIDNIVLKQGDKTWTENFENASATDFQNQALKLSDYFKPSAKFIETGAVGTGDKKIYLQAKGSNNGPWAFLKLPSISNGVYELSLDYLVGRKDNDYMYINHESGDAEQHQFPNKTNDDEGKLSRLKLTIDKDNNKVTTSWVGADGTDKGSEFAITNSTPITSITFRNHNTATRHAWIDNVEFKRISGSEEFNPNVVGETLLAKADFEDYTKTKADYGFYTNGSSAFVGGKNGRGVSAALTSGDYSYNERYMGYEFSNANNGEVLGEGTYHVRFAYNSYENSGRNDICFSNAYNVSSAYKSVVLSTETLNSFGNQWVDVDIEFEIPSRNWTATVVSPSGQTYTTSGTYSNTNNQIPAITWWMKPTENYKSYAAPAVDNFYITKELANTSLDDSAFTLLANHEVIENKNVPLTGVTALVNLANEATAASVTKEKVKLLENGTEIDYNGYADGTMWVIEPYELKYGKTYAVSVEAGIPNGNGAYIKPRTFVFRTVKENASEVDVLYENDFTYTTKEEISSWYGIGGDNHEGFEYPFIASWGMSLTEGIEGNGITIDMNKDERDFELLMGYTHTGKYKLTYDFYPSAGTDIVNLCAKPDSWSGRTTLMERSGLPRQWLNVEIIVDLNKDTADIMVRNDLGAEVYSNSIDNYTSSLAGFEFSRTVEGGTTGETLSKSSVFDNIMLCKLPGIEVPDSYVKGIFDIDGEIEYKTPADIAPSEQIAVKLACDKKGEGKTVVCFAGFYDESGKLIMADASEIIEFTKADTEETAIFTAPENMADVSGVRFYVWDSLSNASDIIANQQVIGNKNVPVSGVTAIVDFPNSAAIASASKDNVKLLENGVAVDYNGYAEGTMWVIEPAELKYDTTYAISIEKGIPDGNGAIINPRTYVFKTVRETVIPENNILGDVDFEDWTVDTQSENYGGSDTTPGDGFTVWSTSGFVAGPDGTGQAMPMYMSAAVARSMQFWPVGKMKNATYYAEFDYKVGEDFTDNTFYMDRGPVEFKDAQPQTIITTDEMKSFGSGWVKVSFKLIHPSNVWSVKVTNELGKTVLEKTGSYPGANQEMTHLGWSFTRGSSATIDKAGAVDNFLMWLEYDNAPEITKDSIKIYEGDVIQPAGRISHDSDKIVVDFGQRIKASEIAAIANNVYIVDNATKEKIALEKADYTYDSGVLTISLQNAGLAYGKAYTLHINALSNIASMQMDKEYDFNFIVARDAMKIRIAQVSQNDAVVAAPAKLTEGEAKVTVAFNNGTGTDTTLYLIVANYDEDGKLISADYKPVAAVSDNQDKTEEITVAVEGYTTTFMIWDGFTTMNPMADTLEF